MKRENEKYAKQEVLNEKKKLLRKEFEEIYVVLEHKSMVKESTLNLGVGEWLEIADQLEQWRWKRFNYFLKPSNWTITLEFFDNFMQVPMVRRREQSFVRAKGVRYSFLMHISLQFTSIAFA